MSPPQVQRRQQCSVDYSKFDNIDDSDDEAPQAKRADAVTLPLGVPPEAVRREEFDKVWQVLLARQDFPPTPSPDLDQMWGYYKYGGMDERALLDQACELLYGLPCRLTGSAWKAATLTLMKRLETESREDESRMWSIIFVCRFPGDPDGYYNHGVLLNKMADKARFGGAPRTRLPSIDGVSKSIPTHQYASMFSNAAIKFYRRCLEVDPKQRAGYINLIGTLERTEPEGWYDDVHKLAVRAVKNGIWYNVWQRPPHFVPSLVAKPWHEASDYLMCRALEECYPAIRKEYDTYIEKLRNRKDWDDSDQTPGMSDVGSRPGALHDGGLKKSGHWREVPLFTNGTLQRDYAEFFPETVQVLREHCGDATGLAFCCGGDIIFSVLTPGTRLRPHCGPSNARLTCHLGVRVPRSAEEGCWVRVASETRRGWEEGRCLVFDDSFEHEVFFEESTAADVYPGERVVLLANFWHPDFCEKNDPEWRQKSDTALAQIDVESLPQTAMVKVGSG